MKFDIRWIHSCFKTIVLKLWHCWGRENQNWDKFIWRNFEDSAHQVSTNPISRNSPFSCFLWGILGQPTMSSCKRKQILSGLHPCPVYYHQIPNHRHTTAQSFSDKEEVEKPVHWSWGTCQNFLNFFNFMSAKILIIRKGINLKTRKRA